MQHTPLNLTTCGLFDEAPALKETDLLLVFVSQDLDLRRQAIVSMREFSEHSAVILNPVFEDAQASAPAFFKSANHKIVEFLEAFDANTSENDCWGCALMAYAASSIHHGTPLELTPNTFLLISFSALQKKFVSLCNDHIPSLPKFIYESILDNPANPTGRKKPTLQ